MSTLKKCQGTGFLSSLVPDFLQVRLHRMRLEPNLLFSSESRQKTKRGSHTHQPPTRKFRRVLGLGCQFDLHLLISCEGLFSQNFQISTIVLFKKNLDNTLTIGWDIAIFFSQHNNLAILKKISSVLLQAYSFLEYSVLQNWVHRYSWGVTF